MSMGARKRLASERDWWLVEAVVGVSKCSAERLSDSSWLSADSPVTLCLKFATV